MATEESADLNTPRYLADEAVHFKRLYGCAPSTYKLSVPDQRQQAPSTGFKFLIK